MSMQNPYRYTLDNKRYQTFNYYLKTLYQKKVAKVILDLDFTCPNRDGSKGFGGCIYCSARGSGDTSAIFDGDIVRQYEKNLEVMHTKWPAALTIPYFQSFSNTYGPLSKIKKYVESLIYRDEVVELSIATRADCLDDEVIGYLDEMCDIKPIWLELGLQTSNDKTAAFINRCHTFAEFKKTMERLNKTKIKTCIHIIDGLPYETFDDMLKTIKDLNDFDYDAIKIHMLEILKGTRLAEIYEKDPFSILSRDAYIDIVTKQLALIKEDIIVERLTADPIKNDLIAPMWLLNKTTILNDIDKLMVKKDLWQGKYHESTDLLP